MDHIGIDVHKRESQISMLVEGGTIVEQRIRTEPERFAAVLGARPHARVLIEASTDSEWVARCLEALGHEVSVADPNVAPMYATRTRRVKTDRRDARALAEACLLGAYRPAHRLSDPQRHVRGRWLVRDAVVRTRTRYISLIRALLRQHGVRVPSGSAESFVHRVQGLPLPGRVRSVVAPLCALMRPLNQPLSYSDATIEHLAVQDPRVPRLRSGPCVGPITAAAFLATIDDVGRFPHAHQLEAYLGLVPREYSSGETPRRGPITKAGHSRTRWLLIQAAVSILRRRPPQAEALRTWALRIAARRGKQVAVVAQVKGLPLWATGASGAQRRPPRAEDRRMSDRASCAISTASPASTAPSAKRPAPARPAPAATGTLRANPAGMAPTAPGNEGSVTPPLHDAGPAAGRGGDTAPRCTAPDRDHRLRPRRQSTHVAMVTG